MPILNLHWCYFLGLLNVTPYSCSSYILKTWMAAMGRDEWPKNQRPIRESKVFAPGVRLILNWWSESFSWLILCHVMCNGPFYGQDTDPTWWNSVIHRLRPTAQGWNLWVKYFAHLTHLQGLWPCSGILVIDPTRAAPVKFCYCQWVRVLLYWGALLVGS